MSEGTLGAVIAGGLSTRFGSPKALAEVGGERVVDRVVRVLTSTLPSANIVCIANDAQLAQAIGLPSRGDVVRGAGALGGIHAALLWARERDCTGALAVGCDMPFLQPALLRALVERAGTGADVVVPASEGPRGIEPLCAWYAVTCTSAIEAAVARGDLRVIGFHGDVRIDVIPLDEVRAFDDPARMFMNLNTPADRAAAERLLSAP